MKYSAQLIAAALLLQIRKITTETMVLVSPMQASNLCRFAISAIVIIGGQP